MQVRIYYVYLSKSDTFEAVPLKAEILLNVIFLEKVLTYLASCARIGLWI
jgi:hypothetical protein